MKVWILVICFCILSSCSNHKDRILPTEQSLTESIYASVMIQPDSLYQVYANVSGILDSNLVQEGDLVEIDDHLFQITNNAPKLNTQNAQIALNLARENYNGSSTILNSISDEITAAELKFKNDSINYFRQKKLWEKNIGSKEQYDTKKLNYELASNQLRLLQTRYRRTENELLTALLQAENNYKSSSISTSDFTIDSKMNGKVYAIYKEPGEIVTFTEPLGAIGSADRFIIEMLVDEVDIIKVSETLDIYITLDAYEGEVFKGKVFKIYPKKDQRNQTFKVEAYFVDPPKALYPGLSGEANIVVREKDSVLTVPKSFVIDGNYVKTEDGLVEISIGIQNMEFVEVRSGITKNTYIYKPE